MSLPMLNPDELKIAPNAIGKEMGISAVQPGKAEAFDRANQGPSFKRPSRGYGIA